jgi:DNA-binding NarL/FixJ family response regulator|nr:MAG TPA: response regulator [Bacteriophage sp.]DAY93198.1 MAG TPA: response regulator [Caudoviricetes sp.]
MKFTKFIKPELEQIKENANFTEEEERIFSLLCRGFSQKQISAKENLSLRTIEYRVRDIKDKIERTGVFDWMKKNC